MSSLKLVLDRLVNRVNFVEEEQTVAATLINSVEDDRFGFFFRSVADLFEQCFDLRLSTKSKHLSHLLETLKMFLLQLIKLVVCHVLKKQFLKNVAVVGTHRHFDLALNSS